MHTIGVSVEFDSAHRLFPYEGKCSNIHGHRYKLEVAFVGDTSSNAMVIDFGVVKDGLKRIIEEKLDHKLILSIADPIKDALATYDVSMLLLPDSPTAESLVSYIHLLLSKEFLSYWPEIKISYIRLYETPTCYAEI